MAGKGLILPRGGNHVVFLEFRAGAVNTGGLRNHTVLSLVSDLTCGGFLFVSAVAKRKSLFDDKAVEIEELTYIIKQVSD